MVTILVIITQKAAIALTTHPDEWAEPSQCLPYHTDTLTHHPLRRHPSDPQIIQILTGSSKSCAVPKKMVNIYANSVFLHILGEIVDANGIDIIIMRSGHYQFSLQPHWQSLRWQSCDRQPSLQTLFHRRHETTFRIR